MSKTLYQVFKNLRWTDLCQAALVCKGWREVRVVYSFCFCAETLIGTIVVMVSSFPPALFFFFSGSRRSHSMEAFSRLDEDDPGQLPWFYQDKPVSHMPIHMYLSTFFLLLPLISLSKFYSPVHTSGVLWLRDSRSTCRAATSQTVRSTLATLGLFCKRS